MENKKTIPPNTFPKAEKLKSRKAIDGLFKDGKSFFIHPYKVFYQMVDGAQNMADSGLGKENVQQVSVDMPLINSNDEQFAGRHLPTANRQLSAIQVGFAVSTKIFKHAVDRNRIKRLGREAYRLNKHALIAHVASNQLQLQVFFVFTNKSLPTFAQVQQAMQACLRKLMKTISIEDLKI